MLFDRSEYQGYPVLHIRGAVPVSQVQDLAGALEALAADAVTDAVLDLTLCPYFPSMALPPLLGCHRKLAEQGKTLQVAVSEELKEIFRVLKLDRELALHASVAASVKAASVGEAAPA